jgi:succinate dehydrogenase/fumarate reductase flavoprotein subunit
MIQAAAAYEPHLAHAWLLADRRAVRRYGIGAARPFPFPLRSHIASGYVLTGRSPTELAKAIGVPGDVLSATIERYNAGAATGRDPDFGRGALAYNRFMGDPNHRPNPCVAPLRGRLYAIRLLAGDAGTTFGLKVDRDMRVIDGDGVVIDGLYAVGNDVASVFRGGYPGGGATLGPALAFGYVAGCAIAGVATAENPRYHAQA